jgi:predicted ATPase
MLSALHLKSASSVGQPNLVVPLQPSVTIFVGPNNSGKSLLLREIYGFCNSGSVGPHTYIFDRFDCVGVDRAIAEAEFNQLRRKAEPGENIDANHVPVILRGQRGQMHPPHYFMARERPQSNLNLFASLYLGPSTLSLDGSSRIGLLNPSTRGDLKYPTTPLARIFMDDPTRAKWQKIVSEAFGFFPGIDATAGDHLAVRFGKTKPPRERTLEQDIVDWMRDARSLEAISDGVKAFSGILLQIYAGDPRIILIDEPEAFLHPSLARTLGKELATAARAEKKFVFASTHSADFVMGAIQSGAVVNIVRLTWDNNIATARLLPNKELARLMNDPMLRSVGILSGLFFQNVVVAEADADRAFYQEINERLLTTQDSRAIPHALFLNADNHQTIPAIVAPLRQLGIPVAAVADLDVIKGGGVEWSRQLEACGMPLAQQESNRALRKSVLDALVAAAPSGTQKPDDYFKTAGGIDILGKSEREAASNFLDEVAKYGLFIVPCGEVEAWLKHLGIPQKTRGWRAKIFEALGGDPTIGSYVGPAGDDVWEFIGLISVWLTDRSRRGIPA